ncbi:hypothetical protein DINM_005403 [Dirofilaria immitis]|nr:hypothetical protein [Dirofilaria immitis]
MYKRSFASLNVLCCPENTSAKECNLIDAAKQLIAFLSDSPSNQKEHTIDVDLSPSLSSSSVSSCVRRLIALTRLSVYAFIDNRPERLSAIAREVSSSSGLNVNHHIRGRKE